MKKLLIAFVLVLSMVSQINPSISSPQKVDTIELTELLKDVVPHANFLVPFAKWVDQNEELSKRLANAQNTACKEPAPQSKIAIESTEAMLQKSFELAIAHKILDKQTLKFYGVPKSYQMLQSTECFCATLLKNLTPQEKAELIDFVSDPARSKEQTFTTRMNADLDLFLASALKTQEETIKALNAPKKPAPTLLSKLLSFRPNLPNHPYFTTDTLSHFYKNIWSYSRSFLPTAVLGGVGVLATTYQTDLASSLFAKVLTIAFLHDSVSFLNKAAVKNPNYKGPQAISYPWLTIAATLADSLPSLSLGNMTVLENLTALFEPKLLDPLSSMSFLETAVFATRVALYYNWREIFYLADFSKMMLQTTKAIRNFSTKKSK